MDSFELEDKLVYNIEEDMANLQKPLNSDQKAAIPEKNNEFELSGAYAHSVDIQEDLKKHSTHTQTDSVDNDAETIIIADTTTKSTQTSNLQFNVQTLKQANSKKLRSHKHHQKKELHDRKKSNKDKKQKSEYFVCENNSLKLNKTFNHNALVHVGSTNDIRSGIDAGLSERSDRTDSCKQTGTNTYLKLLSIDEIPRVETNNALPIADHHRDFGTNNANVLIEQQELETNNDHSIMDNRESDIENADWAMERQGSYLQPNEIDRGFRRSNINAEKDTDYQDLHHYDDVDTQTNSRVQKNPMCNSRLIKLLITVLLLNIIIFGALGLYISFKGYPEQPTNTQGFQTNSSKGEMVSFSAKLLRKGSNNVGQKRLVFDDVTLNIGSGYNKSDGIFYCPIGGVYAISVFTNRLIYDSHLMILVIISKNHPFPVIHFYNTISLFLKLSAADRIWVENSRSDIREALFTGYLIKT